MNITYTTEHIEPCPSCRAKGLMSFSNVTLHLPPGKEELTREDMQEILFGKNWRDIKDHSKRVNDIDDARVLADHEQAQRDRRPTLVKT